MDREDRKEGWRCAARRARVALLVAALLVALPAVAGARRPADFAGCEEKRRVTIHDFPASLDGEGAGPGAAQQAEIDRALERIRASFGGCGRSPGYDWVEVHGYASEDERDAEGLSQQRAETARALLRAGIGEDLAEAVRLELARGEGVSPASEGEPPGRSRRVVVHLCRTFAPFHRNLGTIEDASLARYAKTGDRFEQAEMRAVRDQLLLWSADLPHVASPMGRITKRFWEANGACSGDDLLARLERVRGDFYDYHVRPHEYELGRLRERGATPAEIRGSEECRALLALLEASKREPSMARIYRERLREDTKACRPPTP